MRHQVKKIILSRGRDFNRMTMRKLANNFIEHGKLTTTKTKAKYLKTYIEKIVEKAKNKKESNINFLKKYLANKQTIDKMFSIIGPHVSKSAHAGGYVRVINLYQRDSDGANIARVEWSIPIVSEEKKEEVKKVKSETNLK